MTSDVSLIFSYLVLLDIRYLILEINFNIRFSRYNRNASHSFDWLFISHSKPGSFLDLESLVNPAYLNILADGSSIFKSLSALFLKGFRQPPAFPHRLQCSIIGRQGLNHRVRDENGCVPKAHRHRKNFVAKSVHAPIFLTLGTLRVPRARSIAIWLPMHPFTHSCKHDSWLLHPAPHGLLDN